MKNNCPQKILIFCLMFFFTGITAVNAQLNFYDVSTLEKIEINFTQSNWDYMLDTAKSGSGEYIMAATVSINGSTYDSVGVKYKGNSSYDSTYKKNPLHIALDEFKNQSYQGYTDIKLGNGYADPSQIREVLAYQILQNYMDCPNANFAQVYINGVYYGVYSNAESINKDFCSEHFYSSENTFIKCNPIVIPGPTTKSNLRFKSNLDSSAYFNFYEIKSDHGWNDLVALCDSVTNHASTSSTSIDIDKTIWMLAFDNVLVNLDSYLGVFAQNYYLYKDNNNLYNPIIWDLNMAFGGFPFVGSGATGMGSLTVANMQQLSPSIHASDTYWPLINAIQNNPTYKRMYIAHMRTIVDEFFSNNHYLTLAQQFQSIVDTALVNDTNNFYSYTQFQNALTTNYFVGSYTVPGISNLMSARTSYLQSTAEFLASTPSITAVTASNQTPSLNSQVTITANVTNTLSSSVFIGIQTDYTHKFTRYQMYDDGLHNDGMANDNVYGYIHTMNSVQIQYYIYAENASAGIFSPERAEHEFYSLQIALQTPVAGQIAINEFLAYNLNDTIDDQGKHSDWIELYNTTNDTLNLFGLYLSDSYSNPTKFAFPINSLILPSSYMIVWADDKNYTASTPFHCNFKLSLNGERIILSNNLSAVIDSVTYGSQAADISLGRCPNGTGAFVPQVSTTFNASNCPAGIENTNKFSTDIYVYPNPATNLFTIIIPTITTNENIVLTDAMGQTITQFKPLNYLSISTEGMNNGVYLLKYGSIMRKLVILN
jgi:hypothetical protein